MAATAATPKKRNRNGRRIAMIVGGVLILVVACAGGVYALMPRPQAPGTIPEGWQTVEVTTGTISSTVSATGNIEAAAEAELRFSQTGTIAEILVKPGDAVTAGQALARVDAAGLELKVEEAQAGLRQAQSDLEGLLAGASEAEIAEAQARVEQARRQYQQTATNVSQADIAAARADLEKARANLASLQAGPASDDLARANTEVQRAEDALQNARVSLSAAKEKARVEVEAKANALRDAQEEYQRVYWDNRELEKLPGDLPQSRIDQEAQALRAVQNAEAELETARIAYEQAKQDEINTLQTREAELNSAIVARDKLLSGAATSELAAARAEVQRAQASLDKLVGANRASDLAAQQSNIEIAQAGLDKLLSDPATAERTAKEIAVAKAEIALREAQRNLGMATLKAPFAATIARVDMTVGESAESSAIIAIVDLSSFHVDVPVDELDIALVEPGQPVTINLDALPSAEVTGTVTAIAPQATRSEQGTTTYEVTVTLDQGSAGVRPGMTAVVQIITSEKADVLQVPRRAVRLEGGKSYVLLYDPTAVPQAQAGAGGLTIEPPSQRREVTLGLSNSEFVEIVSGLSAGDKVLVQDVVSTFNPAGN